MGSLIAILNKKGRDSADVAIAMLEALSNKNAEAVGIASPTNTKIVKSVEALQGVNLNSSTTIGYLFSRILATDKPQPIKLENVTLIFEGRIYHSAKGVSDAENAANTFQRDYSEAARRLIKNAESSFVLALAESNRLIAARDTVGVNSLYYGENSNFAALASERKALWKIGIKQANSFPPGCLSIIDRNGFKFKQISTLSYLKPSRASAHLNAKKLQKLLEISVKNRLYGLKEVAVAFSGGLDSSIIASLAKKTEIDVQLIYVSLKNQPEIEEAKKGAEMLKLPIIVQLYDEETVKQVLEQVLWLIENPSPVMASIGIPIFWTAETASKHGLKVVLAGQGADELFGGYKRYTEDYARHGEEFVQKKIFNDIARLYETNLERDAKICSFHNIELRLPFVSYSVAKFATKIPLKQKLESATDQQRKIVLRKMAENLGLQSEITRKKKKAIQYATGVSKALVKLAKKEGLPLKQYLERKFQTLLKERNIE